MSFARRALLSAILAVGLAGLAEAQTPPARLRGTLASVDPAVLTITTNSGATMKVAMKADTPVVAVVPAKLSEISKGSFIGTAAMPGPKGTFVAMEVHIFPEAMRGAGEGHYPFDLKPESTMTNGTVGDVTVANGDTLTVGYKGGQSTILVPPDVPIVAFAPGDTSLLRVGAHVIVFAAKQADGSYSAIRVLAGKDGLTPPM